MVCTADSWAQVAIFSTILAAESHLYAKDCFLGQELPPLPDIARSLRKIPPVTGSRRSIFSHIFCNARQALNRICGALLNTRGLFCLEEASC
jgi:hypothetical protein